MDDEMEAALRRVGGYARMTLGAERFDAAQEAAEANQPIAGLPPGRLPVAEAVVRRHVTQVSRRPVCQCGQRLRQRHTRLWVDAGKR
jgi:hypothetical protein